MTGLFTVVPHAVCMTSWYWYLTRSTGIVAAVLAVASMVLGLFFSSRNMGNRRKPNWWLAVHNWLGGLTLGFIAAHMLLAFLDTDMGLRFVDLFVPNDTAGWPIGWGVIAFWLFAIVVLPSVARIRRRLPRKAWHIVHLLSFPALALTAVHSFQAGTDRPSEYFVLTFAALVGISLYPVLIRLFGIAARRRPAGAA
jgi:DMSO/TMAO reductase YedYZ heme-binding membrane subunit